MSYFHLNGEPFMDLDLGFLEELAAVLDKQIDQLDAEQDDCPDPDGYGIFDSYEAVTGLGFVACQQYINTTWTQTPAAVAAMVLPAGKPRKKALAAAKLRALRVGPTVASGSAVAEVVNAAANYWKHRDEWSGARPTPQAEMTLGILRAAGTDVPVFLAGSAGSFDALLAGLLGNYVLSAVLGAITAHRARRFATVASLLEEWRDATARTPA